MLNRTLVRDKWTPSSRTYSKDGEERKFILEASVGHVNYYNGIEHRRIDLGLFPSDDPDNFTWILWRARFKMYLNYDGAMRLYPWYWTRPDDYVEKRSVHGLAHEYCKYDPSRANEYSAE